MIFLLNRLTLVVTLLLEPDGRHRPPLETYIGVSDRVVLAAAFVFLFSLVGVGFGLFAAVSLFWFLLLRVGFGGFAGVCVFLSFFGGHIHTATTFSKHICVFLSFFLWFFLSFFLWWPDSYSDHFFKTHMF